MEGQLGVLMQYGLVPNVGVRMLGMVDTYTELVALVALVAVGVKNAVKVYVLLKRTNLSTKGAVKVGAALTTPLTV